jgi:hypothetical protein
MTFRFRVLESFDGGPPQNDESLSVVPLREYEKSQKMVEQLTTELQATRELAFQDGYKSASQEARSLVEEYYQKLASNMIEKVTALEQQLEASKQMLADHYASILYTVAKQLLPRYITTHQEEDFVHKMKEVLTHDDDRRIIIMANKPMIERLQSLEGLPQERTVWRVNAAIHDGNIDATWDRGGYHSSSEKILKAVDEILTSSLNINQARVEHFLSQTETSPSLSQTALSHDHGL